MEHTEQNKRIAKNSILLYVRMIFVMAVAFYSSRIILSTLGITDYGIYNIVAGVITMLGFLTGALGNTASRYITFALGQGDIKKTEQVFNTILILHLGMSFLILILGESIGLLLVHYKLVIPTDRFQAALWVYQCSIFTFIGSLMRVPYNALIIAHERMNAYAYISVFEVSAKLGILFIIMKMPYDRLINYAIWLLLIQIVILCIHIIYTHTAFKDVKHKATINKKLFHEIMEYIGWSSSGFLAIIGYGQGINVLLNLFFGPVANAAQGITIQVQSAVNQFFTNFQMAVNPQITKSYASGNLSYMHQLIIFSSKYSFFMVWIVALPILFYTEEILKWWLGNIPTYTADFVRIMLLICMDATLSGPCLTAIHATGHIKKFQIIEASMLLCIVPVAYIGLKFFHLDATWVFLSYLIIELITQCARMWIIFPEIGLRFSTYCKQTLIPIGTTVIFSFIGTFGINIGCEHFKINAITSMILIGFTTLTITMITGISPKERNYIRQKIHFNF